MTEIDEPLLTRARGRPKHIGKAQIVDRLLDATERLLVEQGSHSTTERKIAAAAGVSEAIIHYYFKGKDGLFSAVLDRLCAKISLQLDALLDENVGALDNPMRHIVKVLVDTYYTNAQLAKIMITEVTRDSVIKKQFRERYGMQGLAKLESAIRKLIERGVYDQHIDAAKIALSLFSIVCAPLVLAQVADPGRIDVDDLRKEEWIGFLAEMFDRQMRPARHH